MILSKYKSDRVTPLIKGQNSLQWQIKPHISQHPAPMVSHFIIYFSAPRSLSSARVLLRPHSSPGCNHTQHGPSSTSGRLHWPFLLTGMLFPQTSRNLILLVLQISAQNSPSQGSVLTTPFKIALVRLISFPCSTLFCP